MPPLSKTELARLYSPGMSDHSALNRLTMWINRNPDLMAALRETHYFTNQRIFSSKQLRIIFHYLGEP